MGDLAPSIVEVTPQDPLRILSTGPLTPNRKTLERFASAYGRIPGVVDCIDEIAKSADIDDLSHEALLDRVSTEAQKLASIIAITGEQAGEIRAVLERAARLTDREIQLSRHNPFIVERPPVDAQQTPELGLISGDLGQGGFGAVKKFLLGRGRTLALKIFEPQAANPDRLTELRRRFVNEFRVLRELPDIVPRAEFMSGAEAEPPYFAMEFVDGLTVADLNHVIHSDTNPDAPRPDRWTFLLYSAIAKAIDEVHTLHGAEEATDDTLTFIEETALGTSADKRKGLVHRDLKPQNIMVNTSGLVKILDFGIAHVEFDQRDNDEERTKTGDYMGTPRYTAPELLDGQKNMKNATAASDVYALGIMLFESLTGKHPFPDAHSPIDCAIAHHTIFPDFSCIANPSVRELLMEMLCKKPKRPSMSEVARVLHNAFLEDANEKERTKYVDFLSTSARERSVPLPTFAKQPEVSAVPSGANARTFTFNDKVLDLVPNGQLPTIQSPRGTVYEVNPSDGMPMRVGAARRAWRAVMRNRLIQAGAAAVLVLASGVGGKTFFGKKPTVEDGRSVVSVPQEQPLPDIPSILRDLASAELAANPSPFGLEANPGGRARLRLFGKAVDSDRLYELGPEEPSDDDPRIVFAYLSDEDVARGVFDYAPADAQFLSPSQKLTDMEVVRSNVYGPELQNRKAQGVTCVTFGVGHSYLTNLQGICLVIGGREYLKNQIHIPSAFGKYLPPRWRDGADVFEYGNMMEAGNAAFHQAQFLKRIPPPDSLAERSDASAFSHVPIGKNSGLGVYVRKATSNQLGYVARPQAIPSPEIIQSMTSPTASR